MSTGKAKATVNVFIGRDTDIVIRRWHTGTDKEYFTIGFDDVCTLFHVPEIIAQAFAHDYGVDYLECD